MLQHSLLKFLFLCMFLSGVGAIAGFSQRIFNQRLPGNSSSEQQVQYDSQGRPIPNNKRAGQDSLKHRDNSDDSISIYYRYWDSTRTHRLDSSISDFNAYFPLPADYMTLGNLGTAARSFLFSPNLKPGFDPGFHAFDIYKYTIENTKFYQTTRPYTQLGYMLGSKAEQMINIVHTQNITPDFNMAVQYRLLTSPGAMQNQNTANNGYRINGSYLSHNRRYTAYGILINNNQKASENGGITSDSLLSDPSFTDRLNLPTRIIGNNSDNRNPFNTSVITGNWYKDFEFLYRHQYDFGQSDSLKVNDSTVIRLFYPRFRLQHTLSYSAQQYEYHDYNTDPSKDSLYQKYFAITLPGAADSFFYRDNWKILSNDFSIISFPEKNNLNQFIKAGAAFEMISSRWDTGFTTINSVSRGYHNIYLSGEYRNRTRNLKWNIEASGKLYLNGLNSGDYAVQAHLKRLLSKNIGYLDLGFQNVNRTPSFIYNNTMSFPVQPTGSFSKENITQLSASITNDAAQTSLTGEYYLVSNYSYFTDFLKTAQEGTLFNVLHISGKKHFRLSKVLNVYSELHLQQTAGNPPVNIPLFYTNNRIAFEGVYYKNMTYSIGLEVRYNSPFKADNYSPFVGQFFYQDTTTISNRPQVNAFFNFRIKTFKAFIRTENLNSLGVSGSSFGFNANNRTTMYYLQPGFWLRIGIWWNFIN